MKPLAKKYHQSFRSVVEAEPTSIPYRSAMRYKACYEKATKLSDSVFTKVENAGFDPAQPRILKKLTKSFCQKVNKMTPADLAEKLEKGTDSGSTPRDRAKMLLVNAVRVFFKNQSYSEARKVLVSLLEDALHKVQNDKVKKAKVISIKKVA